jgi:hypothetical protein
MTKTSFIREYMESLPDDALIAICRWGGVPESEIEKIRPKPPGSYERETGGKRHGQSKKNS